MVRVQSSMCSPEGLYTMLSQSIGQYINIVKIMLEARGPFTLVIFAVISVRHSPSGRCERVNY